MSVEKAQKPSRVTSDLHVVSMKRRYYVPPDVVTNGENGGVPPKDSTA